MATDRYASWGEEIDDDRKRVLVKYLQRWDQAQAHGDGDGPFTGVLLSGADVHWLVTKMKFEYPAFERYDGHLQGANLGGGRSGTGVLRGAHLEGADLGRARLQRANLAAAQLEGTDLGWAQLQGADLGRAQLQGADLRRATLDSQTDLTKVQLGDDDHGWAHLADVRWGGADLTPIKWQEVRKLGDDREPTPKMFRQRFHPLRSAASRAARWMSRQRFHRPRLDPLRSAASRAARWMSRQRFHLPRLYPTLEEAQDRPWFEGGPVKPSELPFFQLEAYEEAVRAYRQLATLLRAQGLHEHATRFAFRARVLQRRVLRCERRIQVGAFAWNWKKRKPRGGTRTAITATIRYAAGWVGAGLRFLRFWVPSFALAVVSGYGYRLWRSAVTYFIVILAFAAAYHNSSSSSLSWPDAIANSFLSFHGRGISSMKSLGPNDPISWISAGEAALGLLLEVVFIATFTQRVFRD